MFKNINPNIGDRALLLPSVKNQKTKQLQEWIILKSANLHQKYIMKFVEIQMLNLFCLYTGDQERIFWKNRQTFFSFDKT